MKNHKIIFALFIFSIISCKPVGSDVESLDNIGTADFSLNDCRGDLTSMANPNGNPAAMLAFVNDEKRFEAFDPQVSPKEKAEALLIMQDLSRNIPGNIAFVLLGEDSIHYRLKKDVSEECKEADQTDLTSIGITKPFACYRPEGDQVIFYFGEGLITQAGGSRAVSIVESVRHSWLRLNFEYAINTIDDLSGKEIAAGNLETIRKAQELAVNATNMLLALGEDSKNLSKFKFDPKPYIESGKERFVRKGLYLETMDSYYCSMKTRETLQSCFPNFTKLFNPNHTDFNGNCRLK